MRRVFTVLAEKGIRLTPDVLVSGGEKSASSTDGWLAVRLRDTLAKKPS